MLGEISGMMMLGAGIGVAFAFVILACREIDTQTGRRDFAARLSQIPAFNPSHQILGADRKTGIAIDAKSQTLGLVTQGKLPRVLKFSDLIACELMEDGDTVTRTSRASQAAGMAVGGLLLGGVGAVVGGLSGSTRSSTQVRRIDLQLTLDDLNAPNFAINFYNGMSPLNSARESAREWYSRMRVILERGDVA
jgi:hypothetical protein